MVTVKVDTAKIKRILQEKFDKLADREYLLRPVAFDALDALTLRIHEQGKAADGTDIGTYNSEYLKLREKKYQRSADPKIIVSLTRQLENDWAVLATDRGYGIGFNNPLNTQKIRWVEERKGKDIASLSDEERDAAIEQINKLVNEALK